MASLPIAYEERTGDTALAHKDYNWIAERLTALEEAVKEFIPSAQGLEKEMQELAAVLECTQLSFLPPDWRARITQPDGRTRLQERLATIRQLLQG